MRVPTQRTKGRKVEGLVLLMRGGSSSLPGRIENPPLRRGSRAWMASHGEFWNGQIASTNRPPFRPAPADTWSVARRVVDAGPFRYTEIHGQHRSMEERFAVAQLLRQQGIQPTLCEFATLQEVALIDLIESFIVEAHIEGRLGLWTTRPGARMGRPWHGYTRCSPRSMTPDGRSSPGTRRGWTSSNPCSQRAPPSTPWSPWNATSRFRRATKP